MKTFEIITDAFETTHSRVIRNGNLETTYSVADFVNPESFRNTDDRRMDKAFIILNAGFVLGIVFSEYYSYCEQDALDECVNSGKLDGLQVTESELSEYETGEYSEVGNEHTPSRVVKSAVDGVEVETTIEHGGWPEYDSRITTLGNASQYFDQESLDMWVLPASVFAEDPALMTADRVMERLKEMERDAEDQYKRTPLSEPEGDTKSGPTDAWMLAYSSMRNSEDAVTLARFTINR